MIDLLKYLSRPAKELIEKGEERDQIKFAKLQLNWLTEAELENFQREVTGLSMAKGLASRPGSLEKLLTTLESDLLSRLEN
jgi:hypothetical protein